ncbi:cytochrome-c peroxidase [Nitrococcus mobilis]|uniref:cytochrome-c peroxidase n=1 Tax=Nitrococcus mobilis TaxID=35797 RepID=UPI0022B5361A|nr:cytochrome c peroxidase [Nitrococcus mobilis]
MRNCSAIATRQPSCTWPTYSPPLHYNADDDTNVGGQFWDGRADSLESQAKQPLLNPLEMANPSEAAVIDAVQKGSSAELFKSVFGIDAFANTETAYDNLVHALASFERTAGFAPFSSKYDAYLAGKTELTPDELAGLQLFDDPEKGNCAACHSSTPPADSPPVIHRLHL